MQLELLADRLRDREITIEFTPEAVSAVADLGFDPAFGARPLKRVIQQQIENKLASRLLAGEFVPEDHLVVDYQNHKFMMMKEEPNTRNASNPNPETSAA